MTGRIDAIRMRMALAGLAMALLGALMLLALPDGVRIAEASAKEDGKGVCQ